MSRGSVLNSYCNVERSLSIVGDRWTLLIMREIAMGVRRFEEIQAQTGMSSHLLTNRLRRMEEERIVERRVYNTRPLRHEYFATPKGKELDAVVLALRNWDLRWGGFDGKGGAAVLLTDQRTGEKIEGAWHNPDGATFSFDNCIMLVSDAWKAEREAKVAAYYASKKRSVGQRTKAQTKSSTGVSKSKTSRDAKTSSKHLSPVQKTSIAVKKKTRGMR